MAHFRVPTIAEEWQRLTGMRLTRSDVERLQEVPGYSPGQVAWGITKYTEELRGHRPAVKTYISWLKEIAEDDPLPDDLVCRAYLTGDKELGKMADYLEGYRGSWFPDRATLDRTRKLEDTLAAYLS